MKDKLTNGFSLQFQSNPQFFCFAPGRTELGGNHTDHQNGCVLAAAVELFSGSAVSANGLSMVRVYSEGYGLCEVSLATLTPNSAEYGTTASLIRGVLSRFAAMGEVTQGFDAYVRSDVQSGSGLSSSAAFEVLMAGICNHLYCADGLSPVDLAKIGQYAENVFFGKPCGLMDQMASAVGNVVAIDFATPAQPLVTPIGFDFAACGYDLFVIDSGADHADLSAEYAAIPQEMRAIAKHFGKQVLRQVEPDAFFAQLPALRQSCGDRACLRAMHFFSEQIRVQKQAEALQNSSFDEFLSLVNQSGASSWQLLQNISVCGLAAAQPIAVALAAAQTLLGGKGACRVHGGGFAGTIQAYVPCADSERFAADMEALLGKGCCKKLRFSPKGVHIIE